MICNMQELQGGFFHGMVLDDLYVASLESDSPDREPTKSSLTSYGEKGLATIQSAILCLTTSRHQTTPELRTLRGVLFDPLNRHSPRRGRLGMQFGNYVGNDREC